MLLLQEVAQQNYSTIEKETLALVLALQHFEVYLGRSSLPTLHFKIQHKKGADNNIAVALSRLVCDFLFLADIYRMLLFYTNTGVCFL